MDIIENNKLIAEFMKVQVKTYTDDTISYRPDLYWEVLMPVVEEIKDLNLTIGVSMSFSNLESGTKCIILSNWPNDEDATLRIIKIHKEALIAIYESVIEFIKWYNKNK